MPQGDESLIRGVRHFCPPIYPMIYPQTKGEVVSRYQQEYGKSWRTRLQSDLSPFTTSKSGKPMTPTNLARRFDPSRLYDKNTGQIKEPRTKKEKGQYEALGKTLKPTPDTSKKPTYKYPPGGLNINFRGRIKVSREWSRRDSNFTIHADATGLGFGDFRSSPEHAADFLANPNGWDVMWAYFLGETDVEDYDGMFTVTLG